VIVVEKNGINQGVLNEELFDKWYETVKVILENKEFQKRRLMKHHNNSVYDHSLLVSLNAFKVAHKMHRNAEICAIAGLLHDFYPRAWQYSDELEILGEDYYPKHIKNIFKKHGFTHGKQAALNVQKYFPGLYNKRIANSIETHMFPLTIKPPKYLDGWIITYCDKKISIKEFNAVKWFIKSFILKK